MAQYWLMKSEPGEYSYQDLQRDGVTRWDGVRNYQARNNMKAMALNDPVLVYHSVSDKQVVGLASVCKTAYPDPDDETGKWVLVDIQPEKAFKNPVSLDQIKAEPSLAEISLIKQSRLSVMPLTQAHFEKLLAMGGLS